MKYIALICARGGSKTLPRKNIKLLGGIPLIGWSINIAKKIERVSRVIVSTDSEEIAKIALEYGAEVPFIRPQDLALDDSSEWLVWRHAINFLESKQVEKIDALLVLPVTAPLRKVDDVNSCIDKFEDGNVDTVITVCEARRNPYFNMVVNDNKGYSSLVIDSDKRMSRRQEAPEVFDMTTVAYVVNGNFVKEFDGIFDGKVKSVTISSERAIDIDTIFDFKLVEFLLKKNKHV